MPIGVKSRIGKTYLRADDLAKAVALLIPAHLRKALQTLEDTGPLRRNEGVNIQSIRSLMGLGLVAMHRSPYHDSVFYVTPAGRKVLNVSDDK
jgi:hypothetical protein